MSQENLANRPVHVMPLGSLMLLGGTVAFILITLCLSTVDNPNPTWGRFWMLRPLAVVTLAGELGGIGYYFLDYIRYRGGWKKVLAYILSLIVYVVALWFGTVVGLAGTLWH